MKNYLLILLLVFFLIPVSYGQNNTTNKVRLANEYYQSKEFEKAEPLYKEVFDATGAKAYFSYYVNCLIEQAKYRDAEKEIKRQIRRNRKDLSYKVDLGYLYKKQKKDKDAEDEYEDALDDLSNNGQVYSLANAFITRREYEYAEETYKKGRKVTGKDYHNEMANVFAMQRKHEEMINEYLDWLAKDGRNMKNVQNRMQYYIKNDNNGEFSELLRISLLKRVQKSRSSLSYNKMLVWFYMQQKDFGSALMQAKALDRRVSGAGKTVLDLAETALANKDYDTALDAYKYVRDKGKRKPFYIKSSVGRLKVYYEKVTNSASVSKEEAAELETEYLNTINSIGVNSNTAESLVDLAHLQAFYLEKADAAVELLNEVIAIRGLSYKIKAECKTQLGDVLLFKGDIWEAALVYGQVEKANKDNQLGDAAKFKKAKLAYFAHDFKWAKAQFDALKASTSKKVANDALFYSLLIKDNTRDDSLQSAMKLFASADLLIFRHKEDQALLTLDSLLENNKFHKLSDEAFLRKAEIYTNKKEYEKAESYLKKIITEWSSDILADLAVFRLAQLYDKQLSNKEEAAEYYKKVMIQYPDSIYVTEARKRYRQIRNEIN